MSSNTSYKTLSEPSSGVYKEKGSRFYSYAYPIDSEDDVKFFLQKVKTEHHSARHHCFAYLIGKDGAKFRANDDGEPSGTAGKPILGQICCTSSNKLINNSSWETSGLLCFSIHLFKLSRLFSRSAIRLPIIPPGSPGLIRSEFISLFFGLI